MEADRFDALTRSLFSRSSRRIMLGGLAAAVLATLGLALDEPTIHARNKNKNKKKNKNNKKKGCPRKGDSHLDTDECAGDCTNYLIDDTNCGGCTTTGNPPGATCLPGRTTCIEGTCVEGDYPPIQCVDGTGNTVCPPEHVCCAEPIGQGDPQVYLLQCQNLKQNVKHCGACNNACASGKEPACCFGRCRDLHADPRNCGACVHRCPRAKPLCFGGNCVEKCPQGLTKCGNTCFYQATEACCNGVVISLEALQFDEKNCGECGYDCSKLAFAQGGCCGGECCSYNAPECCSGQCTNIVLNDEHCGECGNACKPNEFCRFGDCTCPLGMVC